MIPAPTTITAWAIGIGNTAAEELSVAPNVIDAVPSEGNRVNTAAEGSMSPKSIDNVTLCLFLHIQFRQSNLEHVNRLSHSLGLCFLYLVYIPIPRSIVLGHNVQHNGALNGTEYNTVQTP